MLNMKDEVHDRHDEEYLTQGRHRVITPSNKLTLYRIQSFLDLLDLLPVHKSCQIQRKMYQQFQCHLHLCKTKYA